MSLSTDHINKLGLSSKEAQARLQKHGKNLIVVSNSLTELKQYLKIFLDPMGLMMLGLAAIYFVNGEKTDALIILAAYIPVTSIDVFLELKSERALRALKSTLQTKAKVCRDGVIQEIDIEYLVPGDILLFEEGQSLPADGLIIESQNLFINESALTGESLPIEKEVHSEFFAGTTTLSGRGIGQIKKTGRQTKFGQISHLLEKTEPEISPLQKKVHTLVKKILILAFFLIVLLLGIEYFRTSDLTRSILTALTFGIAAIPEEFPLVFTLYLSLGAYRLSKHGVLVKNLPSVETLGNVDVICTDKTGTLTLGQFSLVDIIPMGSIDLNEIKFISHLACEPTPVDAMELAIFEKINPTNEFKKNWSLLFDYPFEPLGKHMTHVWSGPQQEQILAMKGAVEGVIEHSRLSPIEKEKIIQKTNQLASEGKRILGLAYKKGSFTGERIHDEKDVEFIGLLVFSDPVRPTAQKAIEECQKAGIEIKMLTGDHYLTAHAIADELKLIHTDQSIYSGSQLKQMTKENRNKAFLTGSIFARVSPEQKYELVKTLKDHKKVVAMTGDGVNDSPALKLADIGVSMGENATDVARSTAKMVLIKNDFNGIVQSVIEGQNIFANLRRSFSYLISFHIPVVFMALIPPLMGWNQLLLPVHIILLELIVHPISAFAFENLKSEKRFKNKNLVPASTAISAISSGVLLSLLSLIPLFLTHLNADQIRSLILATILFGNIGFTFVEAWPEIKNKKVLIILLTLLVLPYLLSHMSISQQILRLTPLSSSHLFLALIAGLTASLPTFIYRFYIRK